MPWRRRVSERPQPKQTEGEDIYAATTIDQVIAKDRAGHAAAVARGRHRGLQHVARRLRHRLQLRLHEHDLVGRPTTPLPMETNPRGCLRAAVRQARDAGAPARAAAGKSQHSRFGQRIGRTAAADARRPRSGAARPTISRTSARSSGGSSARKKSAANDVTLPEAPIGPPEAYADHVAMLFDLVARRVPGRPHARLHVHDGPRRQQPDLPADRRPRSAPRAVARSESRQRPGQSREVHQGEHLHGEPVRRLREKLAATPTATARCSISRSCSMAAG